MPRRQLGLFNLLKRSVIRIRGYITLHVNGELKQEGDLNQMIWKVPEMISYLSEYHAMAKGDMILSGTRSGVGPVQKGDEMKIAVESLGEMTVKVT